MNIISDFLTHIGKIFQWWVVVMPWEKCIRVRLGKKIAVLSAGTFFRIPFFDAIYIQTIRLRMVSLPLQTITTKDKFTLTINASAGYKISDIYKLYNTLHQPEGTICNIVLSKMAEYISTHDLQECNPQSIEEEVMKKLKEDDYGIEYEYVKIIGYAVVKTFRLIQDSHWIPQGEDDKYNK